jgi:hypothetical protein
MTRDGNARFGPLSPTGKTRARLYHSNAFGVSSSANNTEITDLRTCEGMTTILFPDRFATPPWNALPKKFRSRKHSPLRPLAGPVGESVGATGFEPKPTGFDRVGQTDEVMPSSGQTASVETTEATKPPSLWTRRSAQPKLFRDLGRSNRRAFNPASLMEDSWLAQEICPCDSYEVGWLPSDETVASSFISSVSCTGFTMW